MQRVLPPAAALKEEFRKLFEIKGIDWQGMAKFFAGLSLLFILLIVFVSPWKVLAALLGAGLLVLVYFRPTWVVAFLAVYIPLEPFLLKFVPDELYVFAKYFSEGLIYLLLGAVVLRRRLERTKRPPTPLDLPFLLFLLAAIGSAAANLVPLGTAALGIRQIIRFILLFFAVASLGPSRLFVRKLMVIMLTLVALESGLGLLQAAAGGRLDPFLLPSERKVYDSIQLTSGGDQTWTPGTRVFGTLGRYDQLGTFLCFFLLMVVAWLYEIKDERRQRSLLALLVIGVLALVLTYSRASWFGFLLGFFLIAVLIKKDKRVLAAITAVALLIAAYVFYSGVVVKYIVDTPNQTVLNRLLEAFSYERYRGEYYGLGRVYWFVQTPMTVVAHAPVFGWGPGTYGGGAAAALGNTHVYDSLSLPFGVYGTEGYIDNNWFSLWGEVGTLGLALYLWMFAVLWRAASAVRKHSKDPLMRGIALGYLGAILAIALQAMLGTYLEVRTLALYFWLFGALIVVAAQREKIDI
jgi:hypothetical protein